MINEECVITDENLDWSNFNANIQFLEEIGLFDEKVRILEIGCGAGRLTNYRIQKRFNAVGFDISRTLIKEGRVLGGLGLILSLSGTLIGSYMGIQRLLFGSSLSDRPLFLLDILINYNRCPVHIVSGILSDIMLKVYYGQSDRKNYLIEMVMEGEY